MLFYVGTYTIRESKGIYSYRFDLTTGALTQLGSFSGDLKNSSYLALSANNRFLYATGEITTGVVGAFALDAATGGAQPLNSQSSQGNGPCHVAIDPQTKNVLVANYGSATVGVLPINPDGSLSPASAVVQDRGPSNTVPDRQAVPHAHSFQTDPLGRYAIAADLGCDKLFVYRYDAARGALVPNDPPFAKTQPGAGPRHLAFHPTIPFVYVINEMGSSIAVSRYDTDRGLLREIQSLSTLPNGWGGKNTAAEIKIHPSGKFLYASNRGHDSISAFGIDSSTGRLRPIGHVSSQGKTPRGFGIDPSGAFLITGNQETDNLVVFRIDAASGRLLQTGIAAVVPSPVCIAFSSAA